MPKFPISVPIIARNEENNLRRCLSSVHEWVEEIVVVINDCHDDTRGTAESFGATVVEESWHGYRDQKRIALSLATRPWVLALDADEEVSPGLRQAIHRFFQGDHEQWEGAFFPRKVRFLGRWITHGDWYPDHSLRLFRRDAGEWSGSIEHDKVALKGRAKLLTGDLHHYSFPSMSAHVAKMNVFADYFLERQIAAGARWSLTQTLFRPWWRFFRAYFLRRGFLDGFPGFYIATATAFSTFVRYSRLYEHERNHGKS